MGHTSPTGYNVDRTNREALPKREVYLVEEVVRRVVAVNRHLLFWQCIEDYP